MPSHARAAVVSAATHSVATLVGRMRCGFGDSGGFVIGGVIVRAPGTGRRGGVPRAGRLRPGRPEPGRIPSRGRVTARTAGCPATGGGRTPVDGPADVAGWITGPGGWTGAPPPGPPQ